MFGIIAITLLIVGESVITYAILEQAWQEAAAGGDDFLGLAPFVARLRGIDYQERRALRVQSETQELLELWPVRLQREEALDRVLADIGRVDDDVPFRDSVRIYDQEKAERERRLEEEAIDRHYDELRRASEAEERVR